MTGRVIVVGGGILGAAIAARLAGQGADVLLLDGGLPSATAASFGWINASFHLDAAHFRLRHEGIAAHRRLDRQLGTSSLRWTGCLWWEEQGAGLVRMAERLDGLGYPVERIDAARFAALEPAVRAPAEALSFPAEGVAEPAALTAALLDHACAHGARIAQGVAALALAETGGRITGVATPQGVIEASRVVIAAGTGAAALVEPLGITLPMLPRPGLMLVTRPVPQGPSHVCVSPDMEFRQRPDGRIVAPTAAQHQSDTADCIEGRVDRVAEAAVDRLRAYLPGLDLALERVMLAFRPVPGDELPVIGPAGPEGLYLAVMHSGVTLAALVAERVAQELAGDEAADLAPYRPGRFATGTGGQTT